ncbi:MDR efflux pump ABC3 [Metarhizium rileyi]|uniref:MDR efflux pump ABC3 n=1 Tax=Metarhizium rileyi (strain RCEF 4871) TaxID=1649241 RepID=A0A162JEI5_METRR|nr:MDR efflux pump ABC3 [Metarhizium rileyi RCEF 4871]
MSAAVVEQHGLKAEKRPASSTTVTPEPENEKHEEGTKDPVAEEGKPRPERTATFGDYLRVFKYASKWDFLAYAAGVLASIGAGITLPLMNIVFGKFVGNFSSFSNSNLGGGGISKAEFQSRLDKLALYMFALFIGRLGLNYINKLCFRMIGIRLSSAIRLHYLQALFAQSIHVLDSMPPGYATTTITSTSNTLQLGISEKLGVFVEFSATIVAAIVVAFSYNWLLTLVTASSILFIAFTVSILLPFIVKGNARVTKAEAKAAAVASEAMASIRMIMACGAESRIVKKYAVFVEETKKHAQFMSPLIALQFGLIFFGAFAAFALAFWFGIKSFVDSSRGDLSTIVIVLFSVMMVVFSLERTSTPMLAVGKATVAACQFFTVIDAPAPHTGQLKDPEVSATDDIVLENVTFAYPSRPHVKILDELDLRIEAGKITAIVGPSGSGKSTIVGLIERWYSLKGQYVVAKAVEKKKKKKKGSESEDDEPEEGQSEPEETGPHVKLAGTISTCGHQLDDIELKWWRSQIGLVQQEPFLFNDTIYTNVANGLVGSQWEHESEEKKRELVKEACKEAFADEFIDKLPTGYDTLVGDSGAKLSGGQRQRIAIARSIVRKPKILILDEATSAIDVRGERIVQAALDRVAQNRTTITIAHRLSTIKKADRIVVLKKGQVVESGTHEGLIAMENGVYAGLVNAQALSLGAENEATQETPDNDGSGSTLEREKSKAASEHVATAEAKLEKQRNLIRSFGRFFYESKQHWYLMCLTVFFAACAGSAIPLQAYMFANVVVIFQYEDNKPKLMSEGNFWSLMWTMLAIGVGLSYFLCFLFSTRLASIIRNKYQQMYFEAILHQKTSFFDDEDHSQGTMTSRASGDPKQLEELMGANMASVYVAIFSLTGSIAIAFSFGWKLALVSSCVVLPVLIGSSYWRFKYEIQFDKMNNEVFAESSKFASESIGAFRTVTSLTLEDPICQRFEELCKGHVVTAFKKARWVSFLFGFSDSATMACQALVFYYGGRLLLSGEYQIMNFFVCFMSIIQAGESAGQGLSFGPNAAQVTAASNRILNMRDSRLRDDHSEKEDVPEAKGGMKIELDKVHFKYPTRDTPVFQGLSLTIEKGQFAALVGASGCGKTSIISLLERFYDVEKGRILCNGRDIMDVNVYAYRRHLSLVAQEATLFQGTLRENILLGVDDQTITEEKLHQACRDASIHEFIVSLPEGYNTNIGSRGVTLSGGQKQRVAIARALIRDPDILLLDEATSSLDSESEKLVQAAFERAGQGRTMVVVAHRLATVQNADVIFVLGEGGKLLEQGNHTELLKKRGVYWQMCQSQALDR